MSALLFLPRRAAVMSVVHHANIATPCRFLYAQACRDRFIGSICPNTESEEVLRVGVENDCAIIFSKRTFFRSKNYKSDERASIIPVVPKLHLCNIIRRAEIDLCVAWICAVLLRILADLDIFSTIGYTVRQPTGWTVRATGRAVNGYVFSLCNICQCRRFLRQHRQRQRRQHSKQHDSRQKKRKQAPAEKAGSFYHFISSLLICFFKMAGILFPILNEIKF